MVLAHPSLNSSEPGCDGSDPNVLMCDDFEDGVWYATDCNTSGGYTNPDNDGWCGTIYANPITPPNAAVCGGAGAAGTNCTATHGVTSGTKGGRNMGDHAFVNGQGVSEIYVRFYTRPSPGYRFAAEKILSFNNTVPGSGGIWFGHFVLRGPWVAWLNAITQTWFHQNKGFGLAWKGGRWYYVEIHLVLDTVGQNNGSLRLWMNDCGTDGVCTGPPTLRMHHTGMRFRHSSDAEQIKVLWWENWSQAPGSTGERYLDQIKVSTVGPIGFVGSVPPGGRP